MNHRTSIPAAALGLLIGLAGCNPNPGGPSAPSSAPEGVVASPPVPGVLKKTGPGQTVEAPSPASLE
jgi:hypothetical protein